ncbi:hypothetical protein [Sinobaca sp. H24]|nr:hypothetical protein [Sinobaca sp. H24]
MKVAVIAGGAQNLGEHISLRLSEEGYQVVVADLQEEKSTGSGLGYRK